MIDKIDNLGKSSIEHITLILATFIQHITLILATIYACMQNHNVLAY